MINLKVIWCTVMNCDQVFQTFLYCFRIHITSTGKFYPVTKCDLNRCIIYKFIVRCQPWFYFHIIIVFKKCFTYAITKCTPSGIVVMRVQTGITHFLTVSGCSVYECFFSVSPYTCCHSCCQHCSCKNCCDQFLFHKFSSLS